MSFLWDLMVLLKFFKNPEIMIQIQFSLYLNHIQICIFLYFVLQKQYLCVCICSYHYKHVTKGECSLCALTF